MVDYSPINFEQVLQNLQTQAIGEIKPEHIPEVVERAEEYSQSSLYISPLLSAVQTTRSVHRDEYDLESRTIKPTTAGVVPVVTETQPATEEVPQATEFDYMSEMAKWLTGNAASFAFPLLGAFNYAQDILGGNLPGTGAVESAPLPGSINGEVATVGTASNVLPIVIPSGGGETVESGTLLEGAGVGGGFDWKTLLLIGGGLIAGVYLLGKWIGRK